MIKPWTTMIRNHKQWKRHHQPWKTLKNISDDRNINLYPILRYAQLTYITSLCFFLRFLLGSASSIEMCLASNGSRIHEEHYLQCVKLHNYWEHDITINIVNIYIYNYIYITIYIYIFITIYVYIYIYIYIYWKCSQKKKFFFSTFVDLAPSFFFFPLRSYGSPPWNSPWSSPWHGELPAAAPQRPGVDRRRPKRPIWPSWKGLNNNFSKFFSTKFGL